jgi:hypothetical protein
LRPSGHRLMSLFHEGMSRMHSWQTKITLR